MCKSRSSAWDARNLFKPLLKILDFDQLTELFGQWVIERQNLPLSSQGEEEILADLSITTAYVQFMQADEERERESSEEIDSLNKRTKELLDALNFIVQEDHEFEESLNQPHQLFMQQAARIGVSGQPELGTSSSVNARSSPEYQSLVTLLENFSMQQHHTRIPCFMMDTYLRNKDFFGRQDVLSKLDDCLLPPDDRLPFSRPDRIRVGILGGMSGMGKTEIAIEYAFSRKDRFDAIAIQLGIQDPKDPDNRVTNKSLAIEWLCNPSKIDYSTKTLVRASWLVVFDNADEPEILAPYNDIVNSGAVLITSSSPLTITRFLHHASWFLVQPFNREHAGLFIEKLTGIQGQPEEARQVGERLFGVPLLLAQRAGMIKLDSLTYSEFMRLHDAGEIYEMRAQPSRKPARGIAPIVLKKLSDAARAILEISSFLDSDSIQQKILTVDATNLDMPSYPKKQDAFFTAWTQLIGSSIFRQNQKTGEYWMHRSIQDFVRAQIEPERRRRVFSTAVTMVAAAWPIGDVEGHDVTLLTPKALYSHVISLADIYNKYFKPEGYVESDFEFAVLLNHAAWYQHEHGELHIVKPLLDLALGLCSYSEDFDRRDLESDIRHTLGDVAIKTNDAASSMDHNIRFLELRLAIADETGAADEKFASAYSQFGISWMMLGDYQEGEKAFVRSVREYQKMPDYTKDKRSLALLNLGTAGWLLGDLKKASEVLEIGLADREEIYGVMDNHCFRTGRFFYALGNLQFSQGRIKESEDFHRRALQQYQSTIGNRHHRTADVCHKMAQHCLRNRLFEEAIRFIDQALKTWSINPEIYAREIARMSYLKAKVLSEAGREEEGIKLLQEAVSMRYNITGLERDGKALREEDFDELVIFWSR